jgi:RNA polymerase-binding transcription factor DksA
MTTVLPSPAAWAPFRDLLQTQRADCLQQLELARAETVTSVPDPVAQRRTATLRHTLEQIGAALERLDDGSYGRCVDCGSAIARERLELRPFAAGCVACSAAR